MSIAPVIIFRFKDFNVISFGDEVAGNGSSFTITGAAESDSCFYQCRAVSSAMKEFSKSAEVIVRGILRLVKTNSYINFQRITVR